MRLMRAREKKKQKKNESMNVHGWNLYGCICCKFSFKSYKLVEKNTQRAKIVKGSSNLIFWLVVVFVTLTHEKTKSHFLFIFFFFKDGHGRNVWIYAVTTICRRKKIKRIREPWMQKKEKKKVNVTLLIRKSSFGWHEDGILDGIERVLAGRQNPESPLLIKCNWRCKSWK